MTNPEASDLRYLRRRLPEQMADPTCAKFERRFVRSLLTALMYDEVPTLHHVSATNPLTNEKFQLHLIEKEFGQITYFCYGPTPYTGLIFSRDPHTKIFHPERFILETPINNPDYDLTLPTELTRLRNMVFPNLGEPEKQAKVTEITKGATTAYQEGDFLGLIDWLIKAAKIPEVLQVDYDLGTLRANAHRYQELRQLGISENSGEQSNDLKDLRLIDSVFRFDQLFKQVMEGTFQAADWQ